MSRSKIRPFGTVFLVPLRNGGFGIGVLARANGKGSAFGYFFGPRVTTANEVNIETLKPDRACLVGMFGELELRRKNWPVIGSVADWEPSRWPMPPLARVDDNEGRAWVSTYDDSFNCIEETEISISEASKYHYDRMMGAGAVEIRLTKLLSTD